MCVAFIDLNDTFPKDYFHILSIDQLINTMIGFLQMSFFHAYLGYHHIRMHPKDEEKLILSSKKAPFDTPKYLLN